MDSIAYHALRRGRYDEVLATPERHFAPERVRESRARRILSPTSGFIREAGFTHSLTPARNCVFGCLYCYVPTMRVQGGLKPEDWRAWGRFTTYKTNAAELLDRELRDDQRIYCSPLTDPYQPAEADRRAMPDILRAMIRRPPAAVALQSRGVLMLRDLDLLSELNARCALRIGFSLTTDREDVRRAYEPLCDPIVARLDAMRRLRLARLAVHAVLAPILPCDPDALVDLALEATDLALIADPLHSRAEKPRGATTRETARLLSRKVGSERWHEPSFQRGVVERMRDRARRAGRDFAVGAAGFALLSRPLAADRT